MKYCSECATPVQWQIPAGDNRPRHVCPGCGLIHYRNPKLVVGTLPEWRDRLLLCRRAIEPRRGLWTLPAGFLENGETAWQGAARETLEEAGARVRPLALYSLFNLPHIDQIYLLFRATLLEPECQPGAESLEVGLFTEAEIPWRELAFPVIRETLTRYYQDRAAGAFGLHCGDLLREPGRLRVAMLGQAPE
jgi:ADP-ribose pyrophosphatase YjhB (NUDIX family)